MMGLVAAAPVAVGAASPASPLAAAARPSAAGSGKLRVLCLHSFRTSGEILKTQLSMAGFQKNLDHLMELEFVNAPHKCTEEEEQRIPALLRKIFEGPYYEWWNALEGGAVYAGWEESVELVRQTLIHSGPFDGVLGFSQGGSLASLICHMQQSGAPQLSGAPPLSFAILMSARTARARDLEDYFSYPPADIPALVFIGEQDRMVPPEDTEELMESFNDVVVVRCSESAHKIQALNSKNQPIVEKFLQAQLNKKIINAAL
mmetsp:Transcript_21755/g.30261  ORF Transcript_21755/g.30261 Transcript_21755/m.30261 type:complete len:260 (+) Transcript_21755:173-952(+)